MIAIGSDHGGFELKGHIIEHLKEKGIEVKDFGTYSEASVDYPDCAKPVCKAVLDGECECGAFCDVNLFDTNPCPKTWVFGDEEIICDG